MSYEEKYKEAIESIKRIYNQADSYGKELMEKEFPDLAESKDERIMKNCIHFLELQKEHHASTIEIDECIAWLEKQGEKHFEENIEMVNPSWSEEDEEMVDFMIEFIESLWWRKDLTQRKDNVLSWLKSLKPNRWKPSEEQMEALNKAKNSPANYYDTKLSLQSLYNDLKKL